MKLGSMGDRSARLLVVHTLDKLGKHFTGIVRIEASQHCCENGGRVVKKASQ